jgi:ATP-dependent helicase HepA
LGHVVEAIHAALDDAGGNLDVDAIVRETRETRGRVERAMYQHLHRDRYLPHMAPAILARVPPDLEKRTARVVVEACRQFRFEMEPKGGRGRWYLEFGGEATIEALHGVPVGSRFLGTFDRAEAVAKETLDFYASGHPLVEAILAELADGTHGRVALQEIPDAPFDGVGVLIVERNAPEIRVRAFDLEGTEHPEWVDLALDPPNEAREIPGPLWGVEGWEDRVRGLLARLPTSGELAAACGIRFLRGRP